MNFDASFIAAEQIQDLTIQFKYSFKHTSELENRDIIVPVNLKLTHPISCTMIGPVSITQKGDGEEPTPSLATPEMPYRSLNLFLSST